MVGLSGATTYYFAVGATNAAGTGPASAVALVPSPPDRPERVTDLTATAGNQSATLSWGAPPTNGSTITGYQVCRSTSASMPAGSTVCTTYPGPSLAVVTGLTAGTPYYFTVAATNGVGTGGAVALTDGVVPFGLPGAPTDSTSTPTTVR